MRKFIEIRKIQSVMQVECGEPAEEIRVAIADTLTGPEILSQIATLRGNVGWTAANSTALLHICHHDDIPQHPCILVPEGEIT